MAGIEQLEIHSKVYTHRKGNFGIVKHPGTGSSTTTPKLQSGSFSPDETLTANNVDGSSEITRSRRMSTAKSETQSTAQEQLRTKGFLIIQWFGNCEADKVAMGTFPVGAAEGGMYGMIFDNTFSKTVSKTATFVLLTYPTDAPPNSAHHLQVAPNAMSTVFGGGNKVQSPALPSIGSESQESLRSHSIGPPRSRDVSAARTSGDRASNRGSYHVGVLSKLRRKKGQGYARRYFSLDFGSCTLSYYYNRNSSALRGAIPLSLAAVSADERTREISIDSGAEVWHLKAANARDFAEWTKALEKASNKARGITSPTLSPTANLKIGTSGLHRSLSAANPEEEREWEEVESLVSRIVGTRDAVRRLATVTKTSDGQYLADHLTPSGGPQPQESGDYFNENGKKPFWRRKASSPAPRLVERSAQSQMAVASPAMATAVTAIGSSSSNSRRSRPQHRREQSMHDHCTSLLNDLDSVLEEFSALISESKRRRMPVPRSVVSRHSIDSMSADEFYDAEDDHRNRSQVVMISRASDEETRSSERADEFISDDTASVSSTAAESIASPETSSASLFPPKPKSLSPLPIRSLVKRRATVPAPKVMPPSLISFVRKNVGKDLSTISMPVSANEPTSLLQRLAENLEYAKVLDAAAQQADPTHRLLHVAAFAVSAFSNGRARARAIRKPFNPMLGETFELVRGEADEPGNFRFIAEKVSHRPVILASQADAPNWSFSHAPIPTQKFWGKSAEMLTEGPVRVVLRLKDGSDECYSWNVATVFLRNVVMGEKYIEPVGTMSVVNETRRTKATVEFKTKGMFGGRSEEVVVDSYDQDGVSTGLSLIGTWTHSLRLHEHGRTGPEIWKAGRLVDGHNDRYGFTEYVATLNEITEIEKGKMCVTDSRLRKDQQALEAGDLDVAEEYKKALEESQRARRRKFETTGEEWTPRWFVRGNSDEDVWRLKLGKDGYWEERARGSWTDVEDVLAIGDS
ncbi:MAG: hypothetical protein M1818_006325 [Claussenomyces sp. TS43310]|nr:MAG: hypothetical protein M1818_006325 [Claussenomyces sp. TS43310]